MTRLPTSRQAHVLWCLDNMTRRQGYAPTVRELMEEAGLFSPNSAFEHLLALKRKGLVVSVHGKARTMQLTKTARRFLKTL